MTWWTRNWIGHYMPLWSVLLLIPFPWLASLISASARSLSPSNSSAPNWFADILFALLSFWLWAFTTNAHSRCFVSTSGARKAKASQSDENARKREFERILLYSVLTSIAYLVTLAPLPFAAGGMCATISLIFPALVLRSPP
jgi:uncharacterized membrane protein